METRVGLGGHVGSGDETIGARGGDIVEAVRASDSYLVAVERLDTGSVRDVGATRDVESELASEGIVALYIGTALLIEDKLGRLDDGDGLRREAYAVSVLDIDGVVASLEAGNVEGALVEGVLDERTLAVAAVDCVRNDTAMDIDIDGAIVVALTWTDVGELDLDIECLARFGDMNILDRYLALVLVIDLDSVVASREVGDVAAVLGVGYEDVGGIAFLSPLVGVGTCATLYADCNLAIGTALGLDGDNLVVVDRSCERVLRLGYLDVARGDLASDLIGNGDLIGTDLEVSDGVIVAEAYAVATPRVGVGAVASRGDDRRATNGMDSNLTVVEVGGDASIVLTLDVVDGNLVDEELLVGASDSVVLSDLATIDTVGDGDSVLTTGKIGLVALRRLETISRADPREVVLTRATSDVGEVDCAIGAADTLCARGQLCAAGKCLLRQK